MRDKMDLKASSADCRRCVTELRLAGLAYQLTGADSIMAQNEQYARELGQFTLKTVQSVCGSWKRYETKWPALAELLKLCREIEPEPAFEAPRPAIPAPWAPRPASETCITENDKLAADIMAHPERYFQPAMMLRLWEGLVARRSA